MDFSDFIDEKSKIKKYLLINKQVDKYNFVDMLISKWFNNFVKN